MSIKIIWTKEIEELADSGRYMPGVIDEVIEIIERDLNAVRIDGGLTPTGTHGCIEVEG